MTSQSEPPTPSRGSATPISALTPTQRFNGSPRCPSLHCWQGNDVRGFEQLDGALGEDSPPRAVIPAGADRRRLRRDAAKALSLVPGTHRFNLHAFYGEFGARPSA
jgi:L-rhamnose isomerase